MTTVTDADGRRAAYARYFLELAGGPAYRSQPGRRPDGAAVPEDLLNFQYDPAACAIALGWPGATVADTAVRLRPDGALDRDPTGHPVRLVTALDGAAFNNHWLDTIQSLPTA